VALVPSVEELAAERLVELGDVIDVVGLERVPNGINDVVVVLVEVLWVA